MAPDWEPVELVVARLRDYWGRRTDWQRRLWNPSSFTVLAETLELALAYGDEKINSRALTELARAATKQACGDKGVGPPELRKKVRKLLTEIDSSSTARRQLEYILKTHERDYLKRWQSILRDPKEAQSVEPLSRVIGAYLIDLGHSPEALHRWATWFMNHESTGSTETLFESAVAVAERKPRSWEVFVPFLSLARHRQVMPREWLEPQTAKRWLQDHAPNVSTRHNGGFLFNVEALDAWRASEIVSDLIVSLSARVSVGMPGNNKFEPVGHAVVGGINDLIRLERPRRQVDVHALHRQNALFSMAEKGLDGRLRSAIDLLAPLETGAPGAAIAGGWAAIEAALARPDAQSSKEVAIDLAALVTCSLPRAELTSLAYAYLKENDDAVAEEIAESASNYQKCSVLVDAIREKKGLSFTEPSDEAALQRVKRIIHDPSVTLRKVQGHVEDAFQRLNRQRNFVLHAGKTDSVTMAVTLRTVPPLVGAGLDRLVHAALTTPDFNELNLAAQAHLELEMVGKPGGADVLDLLER